LPAIRGSAKVASVTAEAEILGAASRASGLELADPTLIRRGPRNLVFQCRIAGSNPSREVIVKAAHGAQDLLATEASALRLLGKNARTSQWIPRLLRYDPAARLLVTESVGPARSLEELLHGTDRTAVQQALAATAHSLAELHALTSRLDERTASTLAADQAAAFSKGLPAIADFFSRAGVVLTEPAVAELHSIAEGVAHPQEKLAFTVGDMAPSNVLITGSGPVFIDFEYAGFRHAFYDAVFWRCICPFPATIATSMDEAYQQGWSDAGSAMTHAVFTESMALMTAHRALWALTWGTHALWAADSEWAPRVGGRLLVRRWLRGFHTLASKGKTFRQLARAVHDLDDALGGHWPETQNTKGLFPALEVNGG